MDSNIEFKYIETNGITLHVAVTGPEDGELVILLHGFPDFWYGWRKQIYTLREAGYRVAVPDQRGYNKSDKPKGKKAYVINELGQDIIGLIKHFKREDALIIGHDWGGAVGWYLASTHPKFVQKFIAINIPHMGVFPKALLKTPSQLIKSLYIAFFQIPLLPEKIMNGKNFKNMVQILKGSSKKGTFKENDIKEYKKAWRKSGALTAMLNWYRRLPASMKHISKEKIEVPVKIIWGEKDRFLSKSLAEESLKFINAASVTWIKGATHWVNQEEADAVNKEILSFLNK